MATATMLSEHIGRLDEKPGDDRMSGTASVSTESSPSSPTSPDHPALAQSISGINGGKNGIEVTHFHTRSRRMKLLQQSLRKLKPHLGSPNPNKEHHGSLRLNFPKHGSALSGCHYEERELKGMWLYDVIPKKPLGTTDSPKKRIFYFAGGSWQDTPSHNHWKLVGELAKRVPNTTVTLLSHPLAPKTPAASAMPMIAELYDELMRLAVEAHETIIWAGDSSGANIALCQVLWALERGDGIPPAAVLAICPPTDLRHTDERMQGIERKDPLLTLSISNGAAKSWTSHADKKDTPSIGPIDERDWNLADPRISPTNAKLALLAEHNVKVHGVTAEYDILCPEAITFRNKLSELGVSGKWLHWDKQMHCFLLAHGYKLKEADEALSWLVDVLKEV